MAIYINSTIINERKKEELAELEKANITLQLALKEARIKELEEQNAVIMLDLAQMKGGISNVV